ncbi:hypothetical protein AWZ03_012319 [Drosophila navojoa]|uniref:Uncharacterized protein n=1 Tax=Drosophila navojoa TaxID=7232 RepID=A0A484AZ42_DRONA|nr:hypothetical protein AWZ03_012319 [Drosophila navojoa]
MNSPSSPSSASSSSSTSSRKRQQQHQQQQPHIAALIGEDTDVAANRDEHEDEVENREGDDADSFWVGHLLAGEA